MTVLAAAAVTASFAQNPKIDKEIRAAKTFDAGMEVLNQQIANLTDEQKGKAYDELYKMVQTDAFKVQETNDIKTFVKALKVAYEGKQVNSKKGTQNMTEMSLFRPLLINAANSTEDSNEKLDYATIYLKTADANDNLVPLANFFASYAHYQLKNYPEAAKYAKGAFGDERVNEQAEQVFRASKEMSLKTKADTLEYVNDLKEMDMDKYFVNICNMLNECGESAQTAKIVEEALAKNPENKFAYFMRASISFENKKRDEAIADYKKSVELDPSFVHGWYYLGNAYATIGDDISINKADKNGRLFGDDLKACNEAYTNAIESLEKVRELDPDHDKINNWPMMLRKLYIAVGKKDKADEISKMLGDL